MNSDLLREFITLEEIAIVLQCSEDKVLVLLREGRIPGIKPGKAWVIPRQAFITAVNSWALEDSVALHFPAQQPDPAPILPAWGRSRIPTPLPGAIR